MKKIYSISSLLLSTFVLSQVGINTDQPTRTLHVEGNLKVAEIDDVSNLSNYSKVLVSDADGNVDYVNRKDLLPKFEGAINKEVINAIYSNTTSNGIPANQVTCGKFAFNFANDPKSPISFKPAENPGNTIRVFVSMEQNYVYNGPGFQFFQGTSSNSAATNYFEFIVNKTDSTKDTWNVFRSFAEGALELQEQNIFYFQYPNDPYFYRLIVYKVENVIGSTSSFDFVIACEKF